MMMRTARKRQAMAGVDIKSLLQKRRGQQKDMKKEWLDVNG